MCVCVNFLYFVRRRCGVAAKAADEEGGGAAAGVQILRKGEGGERQIQKGSEEREQTLVCSLQGQGLLSTLPSHCFRARAFLQRVESSRQRKTLFFSQSCFVPLSLRARLAICRVASVVSPLSSGVIRVSLEGSVRKARNKTKQNKKHQPCSLESSQPLTLALPADTAKRLPGSATRPRGTQRFHSRASRCLEVARLQDQHPELPFLPGAQEPRTTTRTS